MADGEIFVFFFLMFSLTVITNRGWKYHHGCPSVFEIVFFNLQSQAKKELGLSFLAKAMSTPFYFVIFYCE